MHILVAPPSGCLMLGECVFTPCHTRYCAAIVPYGDAHDASAGLHMHDLHRHTARPKCNVRTLYALADAGLTMTAVSKCCNARCDNVQASALQCGLDHF